MRANEVRITNLVEYKCKVYTVGELFNFTNNTQWTPIPISEEYLLRFKFKQQHKEFEIPITKHKKLGIGLNGERWYFGICTPTECYSYYTHMIGYIDYVHQLQNLYFSIKDKEL